MSHPKIIQGGMGVAVSGWVLARTVSKLGQLGVISGTALALVLARRLQEGDPNGDLRRALQHFPYPAIANRVLEQYFVPGGKPEDKPFKAIPMPAIKPSAAYLELTVVANFVEVFLAKEGHDGVVGINLLEKIQLPTVPSLYGAMLAGVDYVLMGAGIPRAIPGVLDLLAEGKPADLKLDVNGALPDETFVTSFDPAAFCGEPPRPLKRPYFLAIVGSATLALTLARKSTGRVDGFVVEGDTAGGHNSPPRGQMQLSPIGEPVYGPRDLPDIEKIAAIGLPFWLAGSYAHADKLTEAIKQGATGIQVGTAFAFCAESGIEPALKQQALAMIKAGAAAVFTDPVASPTGFPFKVLQMQGTLSQAEDYANRGRICDLGYLREIYRKPDGTTGYRCSAEPVEDFVRKGGTVEDTAGRKCLCNGLLATVGHAQIRADKSVEQALMTAGNEVSHLGRFLKNGADSYTAADVVHTLLGTTNGPSDAQPASDGVCASAPA